LAVLQEEQSADTGCLLFLNGWVGMAWARPDIPEDVFQDVISCSGLGLNEHGLRVVMIKQGRKEVGVDMGSPGEDFPITK
jgi:hypothetical protein